MSFQLVIGTNHFTLRVHAGADGRVRRRGRKTLTDEIGVKLSTLTWILQPLWPAAKPALERSFEQACFVVVSEHLVDDLSGEAALDLHGRQFRPNAAPAVTPDAGLGAGDCGSRPTVVERMFLPKLVDGGVGRAVVESALQQPRSDLTFRELASHKPLQGAEIRCAS
jgi:hypothetical protein